MTDTTIQEQIDLINHKLDILLESVEEQNRKREEFDDLVEDVSIVAKDAFRQSVAVLDKAQVELDSCGLSCLMIKILQNIGTFTEMLDMMESARDFLKDVTPIFHQVGLDAINKMNELEQKGYFAHLAEIGRFLDRFTQAFTPDDMHRLSEQATTLAGIVRNLTDPKVTAALGKISGALVTVDLDDQLDNKSLFRILLDLRSPEVRKSLSYSLRLLKSIHN